MPWIHFHVGDDGIAKACCVANIPFGDVNTDSFEEIWNGTKINQLRSQFKKGILDKRCAHCYKLEVSGGKSIRQETFEKYPKVNIDNLPIANPIYFDIRFSNVCNLKCRTCWHGASSSWFEDAKALGTNKGEKAVIKNVHDFHTFIHKLGPSLLNAKEIYLAGGEPLVTEEHYLLLNWLISHKATKMKLRYNTNFTKLNYKNTSVLALWKHFESVEILASIDATKDLGNYIRSGMEWKKIVENHSKIKNLPNIHFQFSPTISVLNVNELPTLINEGMTLNMITEEDIYINILERPIHYNIQIFSPQEKLAISRNLLRFLNNTNSTKLQSQIHEILTYMNAIDQSKHWSKFEQQNKRLDLLRSEKMPC
tara:strand:- start:51277 stop:52377 length:1101 start_codon:yes stop_codon:yes gene_type:complete